LLHRAQRVHRLKEARDGDEPVERLKRGRQPRQELRKVRSPQERRVKEANGADPVKLGNHRNLPLALRHLVSKARRPEESVAGRAEKDWRQVHRRVRPLNGQVEKDDDLNTERLAQAPSSRAAQRTHPSAPDPAGRDHRPVHRRTSNPARAPKLRKPVNRGVERDDGLSVALPAQVQSSRPAARRTRPNEAGIRDANRGKRQLPPASLTLRPLPVQLQAKHGRHDKEAKAPLLNLGKLPAKVLLPSRVKARRSVGRKEARRLLRRLGSNSLLTYAKLF
jgi:hypothetical protein